ncbi:MAG: hypothetical protein N0C84_01150 [Candidatus Thiodiazotropha taylori]|uniref:Chitin-binding type-3 domain-containing protein n=1 Tax=Candidatus Thiodiazotropha taylori TaxID=2792791 RepID=A0A9E4N2M0_9GAMM|nr:hypothetical protein [Candidatus Thiodiazotropha taylori]MCW4255053.1 hypothetical protein [Candidatus Thiodiazotropha taylori]
MSLVSMSVARMAAVGIRHYDKVEQMYTAQEQATQFAGVIIMVGEAPAGNEFAFYMRTQAATTQSINDYIKITPDFNGITYSSSGEKVHVANEISPPDHTIDEHENDLWFAPDTGHLYILINGKWELYEEDNSPIDQWDAGLTPAKGDLVEYEGQIYTNISGTNPGAPTTGTNSWVPITSDKEPSAYIVGNLYTEGDIVVLQDRTFVCIKPGTISPITGTSWEDYWYEIPATYPYALAVWKPGDGFYRKDDLVGFNGDVFKNLTGNNGQDDNNPSKDKTNWMFLSGDGPLYPKYSDPGDDTYKPGDKVTRTDDKVYYKNIVETDQSPEENPTAWEEESVHNIAIPKYDGDRCPQYGIDDIVEHKGILYRNMTGNCGGADPDQDPVNWMRTENLNVINLLNNAKAADSDNFIYKTGAADGVLAKLLRKATDPDYDGDLDEVEVSDSGSIRHILPTWNMQLKYAKGDVVIHQSAPYINVSGKSSQKSPAGDKENWYPLSEFTIHWNQNIYYFEGDIVNVGGVNYVNITGNRNAGRPDQDPANWERQQTGKATIRYYANVEGMFKAYDLSGTSWATNDIIILSSLRCMYRYTGNTNNPFELVQNTNREILTSTWLELQQYFDPLKYSEDKVALVKSFNTDTEKPEFSEYRPDHATRTWVAVSKAGAYNKLITWKEWNTAWAYDPNVMELPTGSVITVMGPQRHVVKVENWDPSELAWDAGVGVQHTTVLDNWASISQMEHFNDKEWDLIVEDNAYTYGVKMDKDGEWGNGWYPEDPATDYIDWLTRGYPEKQHGWKYWNLRNDALTEGKLRGAEDMPFQYQDAPWIDMDLDNNEIRGRGYIASYPEGYDQYFYGFAPDGLVMMGLAYAGKEMSYQYLNARCHVWDGYWEKDRREENHYKVVPGSERISNVPRENEIPKTYGNPTNVWEDQIEEISGNACFVTYKLNQAVADEWPEFTDNFRMKVTASSYAERDHSFVDDQGKEHTVTTGHLKDGLLFHGRDPQYDKEYTIPGTNQTVTPNETDKRYWEFWNMSNDGMRYWTPDVTDDDIGITFELEDKKAFYFTGLNILPTLPFNVYGDSETGQLIDFDIALYDENENQIDMLSMNCLKDSLREYDPDRELDVTTCSKLDITIQLNNRDYRAYRNVKGGSHTDRSSPGVEFRPGIECHSFRIIPRTVYNRFDFGLARIVPLITRSETIDPANTATDGLLFAGDMDMTAKYIKTGTGTQVSQPNSWRRITELQRPNEKFLFRDKTAPDPKALKRWSDAKNFFDTYVDGADVDDRFGSIQPHWFDNRPMVYEGTNLDLDQIHKDTTANLVEIYNDMEDMIEKKKWDNITFWLEIGALIFGVLTIPIGGYMAMVCGAISLAAGIAALVIDTKHGSLKEQFDVINSETESDDKKSEARTSAIFGIFGHILGLGFDLAGTIGDVVALISKIKAFKVAEAAGGKMTVMERALVKDGRVRWLKHRYNQVARNGPPRVQAKVFYGGGAPAVVVPGKDGVSAVPPAVPGTSGTPSVVIGATPGQKAGKGKRALFTRFQTGQQSSIEEIEWTTVPGKELKKPILADFKPGVQTHNKYVIPGSRRRVTTYPDGITDTEFLQFNGKPYKVVRSDATGKVISSQYSPGFNNQNTPTDVTSKQDVETFLSTHGDKWDGTQAWLPTDGKTDVYRSALRKQANSVKPSEVNHEILANIEHVIWAGPGKGLAPPLSRPKANPLDVQQPSTSAGLAGGDAKTAGDVGSTPRQKYIKGKHGKHYDPVLSVIDEEAIDGVPVTSNANPGGISDAEMARRLKDGLDPGSWGHRGKKVTWGAGIGKSTGGGDAGSMEYRHGPGYHAGPDSVNTNHPFQVFNKISYSPEGTMLVPDGYGGTVVIKDYKQMTHDTPVPEVLKAKHRYELFHSPKWAKYENEKKWRIWWDEMEKSYFEHTEEIVKAPMGINKKGVEISGIQEYSTGIWDAPEGQVAARDIFIYKKPLVIYEDTMMRNCIWYNNAKRLHFTAKAQNPEVVAGLKKGDDYFDIHGDKKANTLYHAGRKEMVVRFKGDDPKTRQVDGMEYDSVLTGQQETTMGTHRKSNQTESGKTGYFMVHKGWGCFVDEHDFSTHWFPLKGNPVLKKMVKPKPKVKKLKRDKFDWRQKHDDRYKKPGGPILPPHKPVLKGEPLSDDPVYVFKEYKNIGAVDAKPRKEWHKVQTPGKPGTDGTGGTVIPGKDGYKGQDGKQIGTVTPAVTNKKPTGAYVLGGGALGDGGQTPNFYVSYGWWDLWLPIVHGGGVLGHGLEVYSLKTRQYTEGVLRSQEEWEQYVTPDLWNPHTHTGAPVDPDSKNWYDK